MQSNNLSNFREFDWFGLYHVFKPLSHAGETVGHPCKISSYIVDDRHAVDDLGTVDVLGTVYGLHTEITYISYRTYMPYKTRTRSMLLTSCLSKLQTYSVQFLCMTPTMCPVGKTWLFSSLLFSSSSPTKTHQLFHACRSLRPKKSCLFPVTLPYQVFIQKKSLP